MIHYLIRNNQLLENIIWLSIIDNLIDYFCDQLSNRYNWYCLALFRMTETCCILSLTHTVLQTFKVMFLSINPHQQCCYSFEQIKTNNEDCTLSSKINTYTHSLFLSFSLWVCGKFFVAPRTVKATKTLNADVLKQLQRRVATRSDEIAVN